MRQKHFLATFFCFIFCYGFYIKNAQAQRNAPIQLTFSLSQKLQQENFSWSIAGNSKGQNPNIYSELIWNKLLASQSTFRVNGALKRRFLFETTYSTTFIFSGSATDTDYQNDNRSNPIFFAKLRSNKGRGQAYALGTGYAILNNPEYKINAFLGYALNCQSYHLQDKNTITPASNQINSVYLTRWQGPYLKLETGYQIQNNFQITALLSYYQVNYKATADWNLIPEFAHPVSFKHTAEGFGLEPGLKVLYTLNPKWISYISAEYFTWSTGTGIDKLFYANGNTTFTKLNDVSRKGFKIGLGVSFIL